MRAGEESHRPHLLAGDERAQIYIGMLLRIYDKSFPGLGERYDDTMSVTIRFLDCHAIMFMRIKAVLLYL